MRTTRRFPRLRPRPRPRLRPRLHLRLHLYLYLRIYLRLLNAHTTRSIAGPSPDADAMHTKREHGTGVGWELHSFVLFEISYSLRRDKKTLSSRPRRIMSRFGTGAIQGDDRFLGSATRNLNLGGSDTSYPKVLQPADTSR